MLHGVPLGHDSEIVDFIKQYLIIPSKMPRQHQPTIQSINIYCLVIANQHMMVHYKQYMHNTCLVLTLISPDTL